jgi:hypothetical protein
LNKEVQKESREEIFWKFAPYDQEGKELPVEQVSDRIAEWSIHFFSERHIKSKKVPEFHREIYRDLASDYKHIVITAPSEFSKTTTCSLIYPLYRSVYYREPYIVICSRTDDAAMELLDEIKMELRDNDEFKETYGRLLPTGYDKNTAERYKKKDSAHLIELTHPDGVTTAIRSIPIGGQVRSRKRGGYRITLLIIDDPEEVDDLDSPRILEKNLRWIDRSAIPRMDKDYGKVRVLGTRIGANCTVDKLLARARWVKRNYKALMPDDVPIEKRKSVWEDRWPTAELQTERIQFTQEGRLADWMWERMNEPPVHLQKTLKGYLYWRGEFERHNEQNLLHVQGLIDPIPVYTYHAIDPAFSQATNADERAQVTFACGYLQMSDWRKPCVWVIEYDFDHKDPDEVIERALDLHKKYHYRDLVVESVGTQKIYEFLGVKQLSKDPFLLQYPLTLQPVDYHPKGKEDRIWQRFKNYIKLKQFFVNPEQHKEMQTELDNFLNAPHLHLLDALEMGCRFMVPCGDDVQRLNPKSRHYREVHRDKVEESLTRQGKQYLLW